MYISIERYIGILMSKYFRLKKINSYCKEIDALNASINSQYQAEDAAVKQSADKLIAYGS